MIKTISIIGSGNVAHHIGVILKNKHFQILQNYSRNIQNARNLASQIGSSPISNISELSVTADLYIIAVPDSAITKVVELMPLLDGIIAHTSGSTPLKTLGKFRNHGVFYPVQTFIKNKSLNSNNDFPILIESNNLKTNEKLLELANTCSDKVQAIDSVGRKKLHVSAVILNNFSNHLFHMVENYTNAEKINFQLLIPLLKETFLKLENHPASRSQTGPAIREDNTTIQDHLKMLKENPQLHDLYAFMSHSIQKLNN